MAIVSIVPALGQGDVLTIWADVERAPLLVELGEEYTEETGVAIEVREIGFPEAREELLNFGEAGEGPDILIQPQDSVGTLVANGAIIPIELPADLQDAFIPAATSLFTYQNQLWAVPYAVENIALVRNTDLVPEAPATWQDVAAISTELRDSGAADYGFLVQTGDTYHIYPITSAFGGYIFATNEDGTYNVADIGLNSEGGLAAGAWMEEMYAEGLMVPGVGNDEIFDLWGQGELAMFVTGPWFSERITEVAEENGINFSIDLLPGAEGGLEHGTPFAGGQGFMISAFSENQLLAEEFLFNFIATEDSMEVLTQRIPVFEGIESEDPNIPFFVAAGFNAVPMPVIPEMNAVWAASGDALTLIAQGESSAPTLETAAQQIAAQIEAAAAGAVESVAVPGSFNAAIGCAADWDPACEAAFLVSQGDGIWSNTFSIPAGEYEFKAALNGGWGENYGVDGVKDGPNIPLSLAADSEVTFTYDHSTHVVTVEISEG